MRLPRSGQPARRTPSPPHAVLLERASHPRRTWATTVAGTELLAALSLPDRRRIFCRKSGSHDPLAPDTVVLSGAHCATATRLPMPSAGSHTAPVLVSDADGHCHDDEHSSWATPIQSEVDAPFPPCWISRLSDSPAYD